MENLTRLLSRAFLFDVVLLLCEREGERVSTALTQFYTIDLFFFFLQRWKDILGLMSACQHLLHSNKDIFAGTLTNFFFFENPKYDVMT